MIDEEEAVRLSGLALRNRELVGAGGQCGCYHCITSFRPAEVKQWADDGRTALCPRCGVDAVLPMRELHGDRVLALEDMHRRWFGKI